MFKLILLGAAALPVVATGTVAATGVAWVDVREGGANGTHIVIPVPLVAAEVAAAFVPMPDLRTKMDGETLHHLGTARKLVQLKLQDVENSLRGILRGFGLKVGKTTPRSFAGRIRELVAGHANPDSIAQALLSVRAVLLRELEGFEKRVRCMARADAKSKLLMSTPAVGPHVPSPLHALPTTLFCTQELAPHDVPSV